MVKVFQQQVRRCWSVPNERAEILTMQVFDHFLDGETLEGCYGAVGQVADYWLNVLDTQVRSIERQALYFVLVLLHVTLQGEDLTDDELVDLLSENRSMSRQVTSNTS